MDTWSTIVIIAAVIATVAVVVWFLLARKHPEQAASHAEPRQPADESGRGVQPGEVMERPAGPGAEGQHVESAGDISPGRPDPADDTAHDRHH